VLGEKGADDYARFSDLCGRAYNVIRAHANEFINLFQLMLSTGIPELQRAEDINWLRECMLIGHSEESASAHFANRITVALHTRTTQLNNAVHILAHG
jgi:phosphatidylinositol-4,5-bisphosphate 3-kinase